MFIEIPPTWQPLLSGEVALPYFQQLQSFLASERLDHTVFPPEPDVFTALRLTALNQTRVVILGQDPYHDDGQAHGLAFSVLPGVKPPPSLANILRELQSDLDCRIPNNGFLVPWAAQGVLLLNTVLTVRAHQPNSHKNKGWETFTDAVIRLVNTKMEPVIFVLWGSYAQKKIPLIDSARHTIIAGVHPSPLSARSGFFGSKPFSRINTSLITQGTAPIDWQLPDLPR